MSRAEDIFQHLNDGGEEVIDQMIANRQSEELFLDFKRSADAGGGVRLHATDRNNLAKAISGFANSEGGVIIWGVDCRAVGGSGDVARAKYPLHDPRAFVSRLEGAVTACTVPPHSQVRNIPIISAGGTGYVATLVPRSSFAPHQAVPMNQYYMRAGSDFSPVPHAVLQGMFGRPIPPVMFHRWTIPRMQIQPKAGAASAVECELGLLLTNRGPGLARDVFVNALVFAPGGPSTAKLAFAMPKSFEGHTIFGRRVQLVSKDNFRLAPMSMVQPVTLFLTLRPPFHGVLSVEISYGHGTSQTTVLAATTDAATIAEGFDRTVRTRDEDGLRGFLHSLFQK